ncbi:MAG: sigma-70 family RNA polymerase sigma factor [Bacteroidales bacterium]|nr:sigma-70 family RNA polymerase sigma factor [Bacteroidales bacterium]
MYKDLDEQELARHCSQGDRLAEDELYRRYAAGVYTLCRRYIGDDDEAKDLMQESLIQALDKVQTFKYSGKGSLNGWISRIAINKALNHLKRRRWRTVSLDLWSPDTLPEPTEQELESIPQEKLLEWISKLPDMRRTVFNLYCIDGYSHGEIGNMLGISEKGSAGVLAKARKQLKEEIKRYLKDTES